MDHEARIRNLLAKALSTADSGGDLYIAVVNTEGNIVIKRCGLGKDEFVEVYHTEVDWAHRTESVVHEALKMTGFHISELVCQCGTHHVERYHSSLVTVDRDIEAIVDLIDEVRDL
ncbi:hypothetical protein V5O48_010948 [Marasmius crinis-equi]|uniref:Uncharacterized protein n=1 Tax=Marasmius crinis-equi TaxID=585013 RepID=A0ABR3F716_9AGAR